jgi:hypothetical protein
MIVVLFFCLSVLLPVSCATVPDRKFDEDNLFADVMGFSDSVSEPYRLYHLKSGDDTEQERLKEAIQGLPTGNNTAIYYAVDKALDRIEYVSTSSNKLTNDHRTAYYTKYYIILFTDGMDNVSTQLASNNKRGKYADTRAYAGAIRKRMGTVFDRKIFGGLFTLKSKKRNAFEIYLLGLKGEDLTESNYTEEDLVESLRPLAGSYNSIVHDPIVSDNVDDIRKDFERDFISSGFSFFVPKGYADNRYPIKMELASEDDEEYHSFEAEFVKKKASGFNAFLAFFGRAKKETYILRNIKKSDGLTFDGGAAIEEVPGTSEKTPAVQFTISNLRFNGNPLRVNGAQQFYNDGAWRKNSEYKEDVGRNKNAYVLFVLDRSGSLGPGDKAASERMAIDIINIIGGIR